MEKKLNKIFILIGIISLLSIAVVIVLFIYPPKNKVEKTFVCGVQAPCCGTAALYPDLPGKIIFQQNCKQCHSLDKQVVGPALEGITKRKSKKWVRRMIVNGEKLKDKYTVELRKKYQYVIHPSYTSLTRQELDDLIIFLDSARAVVY